MQKAIDVFVWGVMEDIAILANLSRCIDTVEVSGAPLEGGVSAPPFGVIELSIGFDFNQALFKSFTPAF